MGRRAQVARVDPRGDHLYWCNMYTNVYIYYIFVYLFFWLFFLGDMSSTSAPGYDAHQQTSDTSSVKDQELVSVLHAALTELVL